MELYLHNLRREVNDPASAIRLADFLFSGNSDYHRESVSLSYQSLRSCQKDE
jgi:hypothetical protein